MLLPAAFVGLPLLSAGSLMGGSLVLASSLAAAGLAFMGRPTPPWARSLPGAALLGLGLAALGGALGAFAWHPLIMGSLVALGGWGLIRFGRSQDKWDRPDHDEFAATYVGTLAAITGAGLALLSPGGWLATGLTYVSYPAAVILLLHLPGWVGEAVSSAYRGLKLSLSDSYSLLTAVRRDTVIYKRLVNYSKAAFKRSAWNALWLGLLIWLPIAVVEILQAAVALATGLVFGALKAPLMILWGISHKLSPDSKLTKFLASWARYSLLESSKVKLFNHAEEVLIPYANSESIVKRALGALGIRLLQLSWLLTSPVFRPVISLAGFINAFGDVREPYDPDVHSPESLSLLEDPLPGRVPETPRPDPSSLASPLPAKLLAFAIALSAAALISLPLLQEGPPYLSQLFAASAASVALLPLTPNWSWVPKWLRQLPGTLLLLSGIAAVMTGISLGLGTIAALAGIGLRNLIEKLHQGGGDYRGDDPEILGGFVGALGVLTGLGTSLFGLPFSWTWSLPTVLTLVGYASSPLLLTHLPKSFWAGVWNVLGAAGKSISGIYRALNFWTRDTHFAANLRNFFRHYSPWLFLLEALTLLVQASEFLVAAALGLVLGALRAPAMFLWGAAYKKSPDGRWARFWAGFNRFCLEAMEGSKSWFFDPLVRPLIPAMNQSVPLSSRPTLKAALAFLGARFIQLLWLAWLAAGATVLAPSILLAGLVKGLRSAWEKRNKPGNPYDMDPASPYRVFAEVFPS